YGKSLDVLEDKVPSVELSNDTHEIFDERIPRVVQRALPDQRKALARRAAKYHVHAQIADSRRLANIRATHLGDGPGDRPTIGKIVVVRRGMDGVDLDSGYDIKAGLLEAQAEPARAGKKVDSDRSAHARKY